MSSDVRKRKYEFIFNTYWDYNKDGCIDSKDMDLQIEKCCEVKGYKPGSPGYNKIKTTLYKILEGMMEQLDTNKDGKITLDEWMALYDEYTKDRSKEREWIKLYANFVFDVCSKDEDDEITIEQYRKVLVYFGMKTEDAEIAFKKSSNGKPSISKAEFEELWVQYLTSDDTEARGHALCGY